MLFQLQSYGKFLFRSTSQHGIHSPFVYNLLAQCFYDKTQKEWYSIYKTYKNELLKDHSSIEIEDFGAGSKKLSNKKRKVAAIANNAGISTKRAFLLGKFVNYLKATTILEIGTSLGLATTAISISNPNSKIITLEGCHNTASVAQQQFKKFNLTNIQLVKGNFNDTLPKVVADKSFDLIFFDGNHQKEATLQYFEQCLPHTHNNSVFIFDDIYWSKGMYEAWQQIINNPLVTVSIDTFQWGIVFFRKEQPKQHFTIRI